MTKAEIILALYDGKRTTTEIAELVGCGTSYVRVVARQRMGTGKSKFDQAYIASPRGREVARRSQRAYDWRYKAEHGVTRNGHRYRTDTEFREHKLAKMREYRQRQREAQCPPG